MLTSHLNLIFLAKLEPTHVQPLTTFNRMTLSIMTLSVRGLFVTFSIMTLSIRGLFVTLSISDNQHK